LVLNGFTYPEYLVKVKRKFTLVHNQHTMKTYGGVDTQIHIFLYSTLVVGEWSVSRPDSEYLTYIKLIGRLHSHFSKSLVDGP
jgi:hypothetical protein